MVEVPQLIMSDRSKAPSEESFEFIETPPAPTPVPAVEDCGVRTTSVSINCNPDIEIHDEDFEYIVLTC